MNEWSEYKLGELGSFNNGVNKNKGSFGHGYPFVNLLDIFDKDRIDYIPIGLVDVSQDELNRYNLIEGDILFVRSSVKLDGVGKVCVVTKNLKNTIFSGFIIRYRQSHLILDKIFASYYLNSSPIRNQVISKGTLSANSNINQESLKTINIKIPSLSIQKRIASILTTCDIVIEKTQAAIYKYKAIKQGMLHDLFTRGIDLNTGKLGPKYEDAPELYKESKLGRIPKEWDSRKIENVGKVNGRVGWKGYTVSDLREIGPLALGATAIDKENKLDLSKSVHLSMEKYLESPEIMVRFGDILIVQRGTIGKIVIIDKEIGDATINPSMVLLNNLRTNNFFLYYQLCSFIGQRQIELLTSQTGVPMISQQQINRINIAIPKNNLESDAIGERIKAIDSKLYNEFDYLQKLQSIKQGLMGDLLSGKRSVNADSAVNEPSGTLTNNVII